MYWYERIFSQAEIRAIKILADNALSDEEKKMKLSETGVDVLDKEFYVKLDFAAALEEWEEQICAAFSKVTGS